MRNKVVFKTLFLTDTHHTMNNPSNRLDNCFETTLEKIEEVKNIVKEENIDVVLHGGDFFNSPNISDNVASIIGKAYMDFTAPIYVIPGNHDTIGNNITTLPQTKLGLLGELGVINILNRTDKLKFEREGVSIQITGAPSDFGINMDKEMFIVREKETDIAIHMVHAMLLKEDAKFGSYMPLTEIQNITKADITLSGDFHLGFDPVVNDGKLFVNPGALVRKYNFIEEMARKPKIVIISVYDDKTYSYELRELETAKAGEVVLDRTKLEEKMDYLDRLDDFKNSIISSNNKNYSIDVKDIIKMISTQENIDNEVTKLAIEKIDLARIQLNGNDDLS